MPMRTTNSTAASSAATKPRTCSRCSAARLTWTPSQRFKLSAQAGRAYDKSDGYFASVDADTGATTRTFVNTFDTRRDTVAAQADITIASNQVLTAGADWQQDAVSGTTEFTVDERDNTGTFLEYQGRFGAHQLQASVRNDDNEQFGNHTTGSAGWGMSLAKDFRLNASYGTGFKAPTFNDLYFPFGGNPNLEPEESKSLNLGIGQYRNDLTWTFNVFETRIDSLTGFDSFFNLVQVDEARIRGAEVTFATSLWGWDVSTQLSHARSARPRAADRRRRRQSELRQPAAAPRQQHRPHRPRSQLRRLPLRHHGQWQPARATTTPPTTSASAATPRSTCGWSTPSIADWTLQARATNVFDREYETIAWFNQPGREYGLSLRYSPAR